MTPPNNVTLGDGVPVGDIGSGATLNSMRALFVFDIGGLPTDILGFTSATLTIGACCASGMPSSLGALFADHISLWPVDKTYFYITPLDTLGTLVDPPSVGSLTMSVKKALEDDYAHRLERGNRAEFRLGFANEMTDNLSADGFRLDKDGIGLPVAQISATFLIE